VKIHGKGKPLAPEIKKVVVSVKLYFDSNKFTPTKPSVNRTATKTESSFNQR